MQPLFIQENPTETLGLISEGGGEIDEEHDEEEENIVLIRFRTVMEAWKSHGILKWLFPGNANNRL